MRVREGVEDSLSTYSASVLELAWQPLPAIGGRGLIQARALLYSHVRTGGGRWICACCQ